MKRKKVIKMMTKSNKSTAHQSNQELGLDILILSPGKEKKKEERNKHQPSAN